MTNNSKTEQQIRDMVSRYVNAVRAKDVNRIADLYTDNIVAFDAILALQFKGKAAYIEHWHTCMGYASGDMHFEVHQLNVSASEQLAFSHSVNLCGCTNEQGEMQSSWMRCTQCWQHTADGWKIVHEHFSAPFDIASGQAIFNLAP
ncbi:MAG: nuclear transport factor 2 family protein [Gammaproteobacteria bacterium]|nr:nuclear transport factor 2 family protein [Gammaproteobacteria bacterium]MBU1556887.1 nuclear transport factor 2 family protein [Gammaproteobacteria bacterium]MBU2069981.1 nuclear transport factor 2 family protein [Gammaproteobacteria bacterium]MBU2206994.1 nuclear transport factor 2 family protein [Gammaproteobacteria bacterium]